MREMFYLFDEWCTLWCRLRCNGNGLRVVTCSVLSHRLSISPSRNTQINGLEVECSNARGRIGIYTSWETNGREIVMVFNNTKGSIKRSLHLMLFNDAWSQYGHLESCTIYHVPYITLLQLATLKRKGGNLQANRSKQYKCRKRSLGEHREESFVLFYVLLCCFTSAQ